jgi:hypothetical protein
VHYLSGEDDAEKVDFISDEGNWQNTEWNVVNVRKCRTESCTHCDLKNMCSWYDLLEYFPGTNPLIPQKVDNEEMQRILEKIVWKK